MITEETRYVAYHPDKGFISSSSGSRSYSKKFKNARVYKYEHNAKRSLCKDEVNIVLIVPVKIQLDEKDLLKKILEGPNR